MEKMLMCERNKTTEIKVSDVIQGIIRHEKERNY